MKTKFIIATLLILIISSLPYPSIARDGRMTSSPEAEKTVPFAPWFQDPQEDYLLFMPIVSHPYRANSEEDFATQVVVLVNSERAGEGCLPLSIDARLTDAALGHSQDMALNDFFSHTGSDGSSPWERMVAAGYQFSAAAENIAAGYATPEVVVDGWMNSPLHRANILNCSLEDTGVGYIYLENDAGSVNFHHYWTQVFGTQ